MLRTCVILGCLFGVVSDGLARVAGRTFDVAVKLKTPRKKAPRGGGPLDAIEMRLWIPAGAKQIRGVIVNPFYLKAADQSHWQAAAKLWGFGVIGANYFGVKGDEFSSTLLSGLKLFAAKTKHAEVAHVPFCFVGMSAGGGMSSRLTAEFPARTIASAPVCLEVGPRTPESYAVPMLTVFGERDGRQYEKLTAKLSDTRKAGARFAIAVQWRKRHEFGRANNIIVPFFDAAVQLRLPKKWDGRSPPKLRTIPLESGFLGQVKSWKTTFAASGSAKTSPRGEGCWLPTHGVARVWQSFVAYRPKLRITSPPGFKDGAFRVHHVGDTVAVAIKGADDARMLIVTPTGKPKQIDANEFRFAAPGVYTFIAETRQDGTVASQSIAHTVIVHGK